MSGAASPRGPDRRGEPGLIRATEEFEPRFGTRFSTYASYWIKQSIRHALINTTTTIRLPAHMVGLLTRWRRTERSLCRELGGTPSFEEIATFLGLTETQKTLVAQALQARQLKLESSIAVGTGSRSTLGSSGRCASPDALLEAEDECAFSGAAWNASTLASEPSWCCGMDWKANCR